VFGWIAAEKARYPVRVLCRTFDVSPSGLYAAHGRAPSGRAQQDVVLRQRLRVEAAAARHIDGSPRLHRCLQAAGHAVGRNRVIRLMRVEGLQVRRRRRFRHTTQSLQYASGAYRALVREHGWVASMSGVGNCDDNAVAERFFASLKRDLDVDRWPSRAAAHSAVGDYIERFYNPVRLHSTLNYQSPVRFEARA
jgi:transposase InsO family protein